jgi:hypothetical protein
MIYNYKFLFDITNKETIKNNLIKNEKNQSNEFKKELPKIPSKNDIKIVSKEIENKDYSKKLLPKPPSKDLYETNKDIKEFTEDELKKENEHIENIQSNLKNLIENGILSDEEYQEKLKLLIDRKKSIMQTINTNSSPTIIKKESKFTQFGYLERLKNTEFKQRFYILKDDRILYYIKNPKEENFSNNPKGFVTILSIKSIIYEKELLKITLENSKKIIFKNLFNDYNKNNTVLIWFEKIKKLKELLLENNDNWNPLSVQNMKPFSGFLKM